MGPLEVLTQSEFIGVCRIRSTWACFNHISLIRTRNHVLFLLLDSLLIEEFYDKIIKFFLSTRSTSWEPAQPLQWISIEVHYSSRFKFGAPKLVLVICPSSGLEIMHHFFFSFYIPYSSRNIISKFQFFFSTISTNWEPVHLDHCASLYRAMNLVILEPKSYLVRANKLQISSRHGLSLVVGHFVG